MHWVSAAWRRHSHWALFHVCRQAVTRNQTKDQDTLHIYHPCSAWQIIFSSCIHPMWWWLFCFFSCFVMSIASSVSDHHSSFCCRPKLHLRFSRNCFTKLFFFVCFFSETGCNSFCNRFNYVMSELKCMVAVQEMSVSIFFNIYLLLKNQNWTHKTDMVTVTNI